jgi:hypothetical protein
MSIIIRKIAPPYPVFDHLACSMCKRVDILSHRYVLFSNRNKYICSCNDGHISYSSDGSIYPGYILCLKTQSVFVRCENTLGILNIDGLGLSRPCLSADVFTVYREKQISKLLKVYNKLRLILHSDIIRHVIAIMMKHVCI